MFHIPTIIIIYDVQASPITLVNCETMTAITTLSHPYNFSLHIHGIWDL